jgi:hypothetical protein
MKLERAIALLFFLTACVWAADVFLDIGFLHWFLEIPLVYLIGVEMRSKGSDAFMFATSLYLFISAWLLMVFGSSAVPQIIGFYGVFWLGYRKRATAQ